MTSPPMTMRALCLASGGQVVLENVSAPRPLVGEALIRVLRAGICNTDLEMTKGYAQGQQGMIIGHEFVGIIEEMNSKVEEVTDTADLKFAVGDRVVGEINLACEKCDVCKKGGTLKRNHCTNRTVLGIINKSGTFAEYITLPISNLYHVPEHVTDQQAAFVEPLAAAFRITEQIELLPSDRVCVIGDGKLGILIAKVLSMQNIRKLTIIGRHPEKMLLLPDNVEKCDEGILETYENWFDIGVDACGTMDGMALAVKLVRPLGTIVLKTTCADDGIKFNMAQFVVNEQTIIGSRCGNFKMALDALSENKAKIEVDKLVSGVYPLNQGNEAFKMAATRGILKVQIVMNDGITN